MALRGLMVGFAGELLLRPQFVLASWLVVLAVTEGVVAPLAKLVLSRPRQSGDLPIIVEGSTSYPSGHATAAATAAAAFILVAPVWLRAASSRRLVVITVAVLATAVAISRVCSWAFTI
jgi:membrane-associated phospholipid phosphatase